MRRVLTAALLLGALGGARVGAQPVPGARVVDALPYTSRASTPFLLEGGQFFVEDFERDALGTPGVGAPEGKVVGPGDRSESVDGDDGTIDGSGRDGHAFAGNRGFVRFNFDAVVLGGYPTAVGLVVTGVELNGVDKAVVVVVTNGTGTEYIARAYPGENLPLTPGHCGRTDDDRFFGVIDPDGIVSIAVFLGPEEPSGGFTGILQVDHLQYSAMALAPVTSTSSTTTTTLPDGGCTLIPAAVARHVQAECPCGAARTHGRYLRCARQAVRAAVRAGSLPRACRAQALGCAARSTCGKRGSVTCCIGTEETGSCRIATDAAACAAAGGTVGPDTGCCTACAATACNPVR